MSLRKNDLVRLKPGSRAQYVQRGGFGEPGPLVDSYYVDKFREGVHYSVTSPETPLGNIGIQNAVGLVASVHRPQLQRVFRGGYVEGDRVYISVIKAYGTIVDADPSSKDIDRKETVPVRIDSIPPTHQTGLFIGAISYTEPEYLAKANLPGPLANGVQVAEGRVIALGGQGGAGGSAHGIGAQGGQGGRGGSVYIAPLGEPLPTPNKLHMGIEAPPEKPKAPKPVYTDVTADSSWRTLQVGDVVTAEHKTRHVGRQRFTYGAGVGQEVTVARTSEVVGNVGSKFWCELELGLSDYDAYKITKVLRLQRVKLLSERRRPLNLSVERIVPANHVWGESLLDARGEAYVEKHQDGEYWLTFVGGPNNDRKIRLKNGRDRVAYKAIGSSKAFTFAPNFEALVTLTHDPE